MLVCRYVLIKVCSNSYRLPIFVRPLSYDLELTPDLVLNNVSGIVKLIFQVFIRVFFIQSISITYLFPHSLS